MPYLAMFRASSCTNCKFRRLVFAFHATAGSDVGFADLQPDYLESHPGELDSVPAFQATEVGKATRLLSLGKTASSTLLAETNQGEASTNIPTSGFVSTPLSSRMLWAVNSIAISTAT
jgi:hypothetical protein